jgi:hypothetical protein
MAAVLREFQLVDCGNRNSSIPIRLFANLRIDGFGARDILITAGVIAER